MRPICNLKYFESRRDSCLLHGTLEMRDRFSIVLLMATVFVFLVTNNQWEKLLRINKINKLIDTIATLIVFTSIASKDYYRSFDDWKINEFSGFGFDVAFVVFILTVFVYSTFRANELPILFRNFGLRNWMKIKYFLLAIFFVFYFPALVQLPSGLSSRDDSIYVYNDLAGASSGNFPLADFMPHYNSLLGWPIWLVSKLQGPESIFISIPIFLTFLNFGVIFLVTILIRQVFTKIPFMISLILVSQLLITRSSDTRYAFTSQSFPSWVSRLFLPMCVAIVVHFLFSRFNKKNKNILLVALGIITLLALINNFEFGLTAFTSMSLVMVLFLFFRLINLRDILTYFFGLLSGLSIIFGFYQIADRTIEPDFYFLISQEVAAKGYFSRPMPIFGLFLLVYSIVGITLIFAVRKLIHLKSRQNIMANGEDLSNLALSLFGGLWSLQSLIYYSARSVDGNLRTLFVPILVAVVPFLKLSEVLSTLRFNRSRIVAPSIPIVAICLIPFALAIKAPEPRANWTRIFNRQSVWSLDTTKKRPIAIEILNVATDDRKKIGFMAIDGNALEVVTGIRNYLLAPNFEILGLSERIKNRACYKLNKSELEVIFLEGAYRDGDEFPCPGMKNPRILNDGSVTRFEYSKNKSD